MSPRQAGPTPYRRTSVTTKATEGLAVLELVGRGASFRQAAAALDMSLSTCWRRYWWVRDWQLPDWHGVRARRLPPQRGTARCPNGRPWIEELDGPSGPLYRGGTR